MATVPGDPIADTTGGIPKELQPTPADLLMAAAIMHGQGKFDQNGNQQTTQLAANVLPIRGPRSLQRAISEAESDEDLVAIKKRLEKRGMHIPPQLGPGVLTPTGDDK